MDRDVAKNVPTVPTSANNHVTPEKNVPRFNVKLKCVCFVNVAIDGSKSFVNLLLTDLRLNAIRVVGRSKEMTRLPTRLEMQRISTRTKTLLSLNTIQKT